MAPAAASETFAELKTRFRKEAEKPYAVRIVTVRAMAELGTEQAARFLLKVVEDDDDQSMRLNTIHQVARMPFRLVFDKLLELAQGGNSSLRSTAFHALAHNRDEALPESLLQEVLFGADQGLRSNAVRYLARRDDPRFIPEAERFLASFPNAGTSLTSILVQAKTADAARILVRIYDDKRRYDRDQVPKMFEGAEPDVRAVLSEVLAKGKPSRKVNAALLAGRAKVAEAEDALVAALATADRELRVVLVDAIGAVGAATEAGRAAVLDALAAPDVEVQVAGVHAVRKTPMREAIPPLIALVEGEERVARAEASVALERVTGQQYGGRADLWRRWWEEHGPAFDLAAVKPPSEDVLPQVLVDLAIERGAAALKERRADSPPWSYASHGAGTTALVVLALKAAGFGAKDRDVKAGVDFLKKTTLPEKTYEVALVAMALEGIAGKRYRRRIGECSKMLVASQLSAGLWGYPTGDGDNSNTQYAVLGLRAAARAGVKVPQRTWRRVRDHFVATRGDDGGWAYTVQNQAHSSSSMTASGVCSLLVCLENAKLGDDDRKELLAVVDSGYTALGTLMKLDKDTLYALYGIERAGVLGGRSTMAGKAWYVPGARRLVEEQGRDGFWTGNYDPVVDTSFAILFLKRATVPIGQTTR